MTDAMKMAITTDGFNDYGPEKATWHGLLEKVWDHAVQDTVQEYFSSARQSFKQGEPLQALETLTDGVRATFAHIAAERQWPHATDSDIYTISAGLGSNGQWPATLKDLALLAMSASMWRPKMYSFRSYEGDSETAETEGFLFASTAIDIANRLANRTGH